MLSSPIYRIEQSGISFYNIEVDNLEVSTVLKVSNLGSIHSIIENFSIELFFNVTNDFTVRTNEQDEQLKKS